MSESITSIAGEVHVPEEQLRLHRPPHQGVADI